MNNTESTESAEQKKLKERIGLIAQATALQETERIPVWMTVGAAPFNLEGSSFKDAMYDYEAAGEALIKFYQEFQPDAVNHDNFYSGKGCELSGVKTLHWPGEPGGHVPDHCMFQIEEQENMFPEEYAEATRDFTGFMLRKFIPRVYPALSGFSELYFMPSKMVGNRTLAGILKPGIFEAMTRLGAIAQEEKKAADASLAVIRKLMQLGFPFNIVGTGEAPFDIIGNYFRGTMNTLTDQIEYEDEMEALCYNVADILIEGWKPLKNIPLPLKQIFIPLTKGMDGFMSPSQYERLYWKPLQKCIQAIIDMGMTPYVFTEGKYNTRLEYLKEVPKGKVIYHFETVDMKRAKQILGGTACISGNLNSGLLDYGTPEKVADATKELIETCAPGGGYIFDFNATLEIAKRENLEAMLETIHSYDKK